jgi:cyclase
MSFIVYPAIDVREGRVVRLAQGDYAQETRYGGDPLELARDYARGAQWLHLVDLDAAKAGGYTLAPLLPASPRTGLQVQTGGGVRADDVARILDASGASRVVVGSLAVREPQRVLHWMAEVRRERITVALDTRRDAEPASGACRCMAGPKPPAGTLDDCCGTTRGGLRHLLCTDIARDGMLSGPEPRRCTQHLRASPRPAVQASGGVRDVADVASRARGGAAGAVLGAPAGRPAVDLCGGAGMLSRRIIPCLDVRDGQVVKGVRFRDHVDMGDIVELALRYRDEGADELVFYDITASPKGRAWIVAGWSGWRADRHSVLRRRRHPLVDDAAGVLHAGADKVSINSPALERPELIVELADAFGVQCVVVGIDSRAMPTANGACAATPAIRSKTRALRKRTLDWVVEAQRGAGEIVLNCMDSDGVRGATTSNNCKRVRAACATCRWWPRAARARQHFADVFRRPTWMPRWPPASSIPAKIAIPELKNFLRTQGIEVRHV